jgi:hypothetical protein
MLPAIELAKATPSQLQQGQSATDKSVNSLKAAGSAPMMQKIASSTGNLHLYDDFLSKLKGSPSWPDDKEAVRWNETLAIEKYETNYRQQTILEPFTYISASPGKDMRSQLIDAFNIWLRVPLESLDIIKQVVAELHNASLLWVSSCYRVKVKLEYWSCPNASFSGFKLVQHGRRGRRLFSEQVMLLMRASSNAMLIRSRIYSCVVVCQSPTKSTVFHKRSIQRTTYTSKHINVWEAYNRTQWAI